MKKTGLLIFLLGISTSLQAGLITHNDYSSGSTITASAQNSNENTIVNVINGNLDSTNIAASGVATTNIAAGAVTAAKIANNTITDTQISANGLNANVDLASGTVQGTSANSSGTQGSIKQGTISTPDLRANAVTLAVSSNALNGVSLQGDTTILSKSITTIGGNVLVIAKAVVRCTANQPLFYATIDNGTSLLSYCSNEQGASITSSPWVGNCSLMALDTPAAGTYTYSLKWTSTANCAVTSQAQDLIAVELRK